MEFTLNIDFPDIKFPELQGREGKVGVLHSVYDEFVNHATGEVTGGYTAEIAAVHEFGTDKVPARPVISMALMMNEDNIIDSAKPEEFTQKSIDKAVDKMGKECMKAINQTFDTEGYGQWAPLSEQEIEARGGSAHPILQYSGTLRESYEYEVEK